MPLSLAYWILMIFWLATSAWWGWQNPAGRGPLVGGSVLLFLLLLILGLHAFGAPLRGG